MYTPVHTSKTMWVPFSNQNGFMKVDWYGRKRLLITPRSLLITQISNNILKIGCSFVLINVLRWLVGDTLDSEESKQEKHSQ